MSQVLEMAPQSRAYESYEGGEFSYRPVLGLAIVSVILTLVSLVGLLFWPFLAIAMLSIAVSGVALIQLYRAAGEYRGIGAAWFSMVLSAVTLVTGIGMQVYLYRTEVPAGYERISFAADISRKGFIVEKGQGLPHPDVAALDGKKIFLKGFVYPEKQADGIKNLLLCRDSGDCCFGGKPKPEDMIGVMMTGDKTVAFDPNRVSVAGTFRLNRNYRGGEREPIYLIEGEFYGPAQTDF